MFPNIATEDITRWVTTDDGYGGFTYSDPSTIQGRWEDTVEQFITADGEVRNSQAILYLDTEVSVGDYLFRGTSAEVNPTALPLAFRVQRFRKTPDLRNAQSLLKAWL